MRCVLRFRGGGERGGNVRARGLTELLADRSKIDQKVAHALILKAACRMKCGGGGNML